MQPVAACRRGMAMSILANVTRIPPMAFGRAEFDAPQTTPACNGEACRMVLLFGNLPSTSSATRSTWSLRIRHDGVLIAQAR
jgi:hypothetical protein